MVSAYRAGEPAGHQRSTVRRRSLDDAWGGASRQVLANAVEVGGALPPFSLADADGRVWTADDVSASNGLLVVFLSNRCPFVRRMRGHLSVYARELQVAGLGVLGINPNDAEAEPIEGQQALVRTARSLGFTFPYLRDDDQRAARAFYASCTPDIYLYGADKRLYYHGQYDSARPNNDLPVTGEHLRSAVELMLAGAKPPEMQHASRGSPIWWKSS